MNTNVYNIIWADDDIDALEKRYERRFNDNHLFIIGRAHNGEELERVLSEKINYVDAVIIDANFNESEVSVDDERDTSGLTYVRTRLLKEYPSIPFFLFTQRADELIKERYRNTHKFRDEFPRHKRWFMKNDDDELQEMFESIVNEVNYRNSDQFRIRNNFKKEFAAAKLIADAERNLEKGLLYTYEGNSWKDVQDFFNPARKIVERIMEKCEEMQILPPKTSLNNASRYFSGRDVFIGLKEDIMPKPLAESLFYFLKITQDGSHDTNDMSLGVDKYVRENQNLNLYLSILYIAMDLLIWFEKVRKQYENNDKPLWKDKYIYEGKVCCDPYGKFYTGKYELQKCKGIKDGVIVRIYDSSPLRHTRGQITDFVKEDFCRIIEKNEK